MKQVITEDQIINKEILSFLAEQFQEDSFRYSIEDETSALIILGCTGNPSEDQPNRITTMGRILGNNISIKLLLVNSIKKNPELKNLLEEAIKEFDLTEPVARVVKMKQKDS